MTVVARLLAVIQLVLAVRVFARMAAICDPSVALAAETPGEFYAAKKQIKLIIASGVGGGYDVYARSLARH